MKTYIIRAERKTIGYSHIKTKSVEEAKVIFETLQSTVSGAQKESPKTLSEAVSRKSTLLPQTNEAKNPADPRIDRMRRLAGLN